MKSCPMCGWEPEAPSRADPYRNQDISRCPCCSYEFGPSDPPSEELDTLLTEALAASAEMEKLDPEVWASRIVDGSDPSLFDSELHPFLDLTPLEQHLLLQCQDGLRVEEESPEIKHLARLGLITSDDGAWWPTRGVGLLVGLYLKLQQDVRSARRHGLPNHEPKWSVFIEGARERAAQLRRQIEQLPRPR